MMASEDYATLIDFIAAAWRETDLPQTVFAEVLRSEAALYANAPELGDDPRRIVTWEDDRPVPLQDVTARRIALPVPLAEDLHETVEWATDEVMNGRQGPSIESLGEQDGELATRLEAIKE